MPTPAIHTEKAFENDICDALAASGWLYAGEEDHQRYDRDYNLYPSDLIAWVQDTQPKAWATLTKSNGAKATQVVTDRLRKALDASGALHVLRYGFEMLGLRQPIQVAQFKPAMAMNDDLQARYAANRLRVVRQVRYSKHADKDSIDLVLFLNGIPVSTIELKTDYTQAIEDAVLQYKKDRQPRVAGKNMSEPLLAFPGGALVHFAVSNSEVRMATKLDGFKTVFLPFNLGDGGAAGNPPNPKGYATSYLWERVWQKDSWLEILGRYLVPVKNDKKQLVGTIFPRYHQLDSTRAIVSAVRQEGPGERQAVH